MSWFMPVWPLPRLRMRMTVETDQVLEVFILMSEEKKKTAREIIEGL